MTRDLSSIIKDSLELSSSGQEFFSDMGAIDPDNNTEDPAIGIDTVRLDTVENIRWVIFTLETRRTPPTLLGGATVILPSLYKFSDSIEEVEILDFIITTKDGKFNPAQIKAVVDNGRRRVGSTHRVSEGTSAEDKIELFNNRYDIDIRIFPSVKKYLEYYNSPIMEAIVKLSGNDEPTVYSSIEFSFLFTPANDLEGPFTEAMVTHPEQEGDDSSLSLLRVKRAVDYLRYAWSQSQANFEGSKSQANYIPDPVFTRKGYSLVVKRMESNQPKVSTFKAERLEAFYEIGSKLYKALNRIHNLRSMAETSHIQGTIPDALQGLSFPSFQNELSTRHHPSSSWLQGSFDDSSQPVQEESSEAQPDRPSQMTTEDIQALSAQLANFSDSSTRYVPTPSGPRPNIWRTN